MDMSDNGINGEWYSHREMRSHADVADHLESVFEPYRKYTNLSGYKPTLVGMARHYGSTASTKAGARRYLLARIRSMRPIFTLPIPKHMELHRKIDSGYTRKTWEESEQRRRMNSDNCQIKGTLARRILFSGHVAHSVSALRPQLREQAGIGVVEDFANGKHRTRKKFLVCDFAVDAVRLHEIVGNIVDGRVVLDASPVEHGIYRVGVSAQRKGGVYEIEQRFAYSINKAHHLLKAKTIEKARVEAMAIALQGQP